MRRPVCVLGLAFVIIILIYLYWSPFSEEFPAELEGSTVVLSGQVDKKEYRISNEQEILILYLRKVQIINPQISNLQISGLQTTDSQISNLLSSSDLSGIGGVLCYMEDGQEPKLGSYIRIRGKLRAFAQAANPGEFDAESYYQILNLQGRLLGGSIIEESKEYSKFREELYQIKEYLAGLLEICYEPKDASVMKAMLLGEKSGLDEDTKLLYQLNGVIHILSISGLHISMIGMSLHKLLHKLRCPKSVNVIFSIGFMYCYGVMTGMSISAVRAIVMFGFHIAAELFGRTYDMLTAMAIVGISILLEQPLYLYHSGFLFSFGAILAIGLFAPVLEEHRLGETKLGNVMLTNLAVTIVTFPVYLCFYYEYPLYSLLLNLIIIPGTSLIVSGGLLSIMAAVFYLPFGKYAAFPVHLLLALYELFCKNTLQLPGSRNILGKPENWQIFVFVIMLCAAVFFAGRWSNLQLWQWILLALLCITLRFQDGLQITVLDVGQGDSIYIADEKGGHYLIDGGSSSKSDVGTYQILPFLKEEGVGILDAVFVTHLDSDHYNGIDTLLEQMDINGVVIRNLILPDIGEASRDEEYRELETLAEKQGIRVQYIHQGETIRHGKLQLTCLHPEEGTEQEKNVASTVLYLEYEAFTALFTGDLEGEGEEEVRKRLESYILDGNNRENKGVTLLKVAHHGSRNSTAPAFLETASPQLALISAGRNNRYGHPHEELLLRLEQAGCHIYQTKERGAITVTYRKGRVRVECFLLQQ